MPKPRTKRGAAGRDGQGKRKRKGGDEDEIEDGSSWKRQRGDDSNHPDAGDHDGSGEHGVGSGPPATEFFGMLADEEQEYFRRADEMLELNQFPTAEERNLFLAGVQSEAEGKELKLASSQSCSRLLERLIQLSTAAQKKRLFEAFGGHFLSLVQHRFASHCCEALFLRSAGDVTRELAGFVLDVRRPTDASAQRPEASMESLFLATLDELEGSLSFLVTDRFASHTLRVLLLVLSGRPLEQASARTLVKSRKKERVSVVGSAAADEANWGPRAVPPSFAMAVHKIIQDSTYGLGATGLRVLAKHPMGNPTLQLMVELDMELHKKSKPESDSPSLLDQLLPGAPSSLADGSSEAAVFVNEMVYDPIGSRLLETILAHCPGKVFRSLSQHIFLPRIEAYVRNDISSYPAMKLLLRLGKDDLAEAVVKIAPTVPQLVAKARFNVLGVLFERCSARALGDEIKTLMRRLREGCGSSPADLITTLCRLDGGNKKVLEKNEYAIQSHGAQLLTSLLSIPGPSKGVQEALLALNADNMVRLATASIPTVTLITTALSTPSANAVFQKTMMTVLTPRAAALAQSPAGHKLIEAMAQIPCRGRDLSIPYHAKEALMQQLADHEAELRECWPGRSVWRSWRGDLWKRRRADWARSIKETTLGGLGLEPVGPSRTAHLVGAPAAGGSMKNRDERSESAADQGGGDQEEMEEMEETKEMEQPVETEETKDLKEENVLKKKKKKKKKKKDTRKREVGTADD